MQHQLAQYIADFRKVLDDLPLDKIDHVINILHEAHQNGRAIYIMGNGGNASTASYFAYDLMKNTRIHGWPGFRAVSLVDNIPALTAYANERGYLDVFVAQMENNLARGDVVIGITTTGNSQNIIRAIDLANKRGATTLAFTGNAGGRVSAIADVHINIPVSDIEFVQITHLILETIIVRVLRDTALQFNMGHPVDSSLPMVVGPGKLISDQLELPLDSNPVINFSRNAASSEIFDVISRELSEETDLKNLLSRLLRLVVESYKASSGSVVIVNEKGEVVDGALSYNGDILNQMPQQFYDIISKGLAGWVINNRKAALVRNTRDDPRWLARSWEQDQMTRSAMSVPLMEDDKVVGVLTLVNAQAGRFTDEDVSLLAAIAAFITIVNRFS